MWLTTVVVLLASHLTTSTPQGYNYPPPINAYLPPVPSQPTCQVRPVTSMVYGTAIQTSVAVQTVNQIDTRYVTTTLVQQQVFPTTVFSTQIQTQVQFQTSVVQQTTQRVIDRVVTQTIPSPPTQQTIFVTSTRVVPQVNYITQTRIQTQVIPVEVTRTQIQTITQPFTRTQTRQVQETRVVTIPGRDVVSTAVRPILQTSVIQSQPPPQTRVVTSTGVQQIVQTQTIPGRDVVVTTTVQSQQVVPTVVVSTRFETQFVTREQVVTFTNVVIQTQVQTQVIPREIVTTQVIPRETVVTRFETRVQSITVTQTVVQTQFNTPNPVVQTSQVIETSFVQIPGRDQVFTSEVVETRVSQQITYQTQNRFQTSTVTRTITQTCATKSGYNYNRPSVGFNPFGR